MDKINNSHDVYFRESFTRREIAQDFLRWHLPAELLACVDLDSLEISKDSYVSKELRASYSDLVYQLRPRVFRAGRLQAGRVRGGRTRAGCSGSECVRASRPTRAGSRSACHGC
ncbi:Rpn family recombination-promoting nuclease/putative transposase [Lamprobacter sp.]|uniref:Rpn family recombination-promoting nuclease/putative transposase n=1 Tax=Lamprobacter sp. TaxID=3100796 RepID=UPI003A4DD942